MPKRKHTKVALNSNAQLAISIYPVIMLLAGYSIIRSEAKFIEAVGVGVEVFASIMFGYAISQGGKTRKK